MAINPTPEYLGTPYDSNVAPLLHEEFHFSLEGHNLVDPETNRGYVTNVAEVEPVSEQGEHLPCRVYEITVEDPFVAADPEGYKIVNDYIALIERKMANDGFNPIENRTEAISRDQQNPYTRAWLHDEKILGARIWRDLVPTAEALGYLTNPWVGSIIANRDGEAGIISKESAAQMRFVDDAIGIRDRGVAFEQLGSEHLATFKEASQVTWLSLASGTAEPSILAAKRASEDNGVNVNLTVADIDGKSLKYVHRNVEKIGFEGIVNTVRHDILDENIATTLAEKTGLKSQYDVVEAMGFEEYLPQDGDELGAFKGAALPQASEFTKRAFDMVKPGGVLMSGNMILNRTQLGFVFGAVDWPVINARSEKSILRVYQKAGILDDPNVKIEMFRVKDATSGTHIYNIIKATKALID